MITQTAIQIYNALLYSVITNTPFYLHFLDSASSEKYVAARISIDTKILQSYKNSAGSMLVSDDQSTKVIMPHRLGLVKNA